MFSQLVVRELEERTGVSMTPNRRPPAAPASQKAPPRPSGRPGLQALAILVRYPEVTAGFTEDDFEKVEHVEPLLGQVALAVCREDLTSPGLLMEHFQGSENFNEIRAAHAREQLLGPDALKAEFEGLVARLLDQFDSQLKQQLINDLLKKPPSQLTEAERRLLRESLQNKGKS